MQKNQRGEILTILTIGTFVVLGVATLASSFLSNKNQSAAPTTKAAGTTCTRYPDVSAPGGYYWEGDCTKWCDRNSVCPKNDSVSGFPDNAYVQDDTSNYCYLFDTQDISKNRCMMLHETAHYPKDSRPGPIDPLCNNSVEEVYMERETATCYVRTNNDTNDVGCYVRNPGETEGRGCQWLSNVPYSGKTYSLFSCRNVANYNEGMQVAGLKYSACANSAGIDWTKARYWSPISSAPVPPAAIASIPTAVPTNPVATPTTRPGYTPPAATPTTRPGYTPPAATPTTRPAATATPTSPPAVNCANMNSCSSCLTQDECGWLGNASGAGNCVSGTTTGPNAGFCPANPVSHSWYFTVSNSQNGTNIVNGNIVCKDVQNANACPAGQPPPKAKGCGPCLVALGCESGFTCVPIPFANGVGICTGTTTATAAQCKTAPTPTTVPNSIPICAAGKACPSGWYCNGIVIPQGYGAKYCTQTQNTPTPQVQTCGSTTGCVKLTDNNYYQCNFPNQGNPSKCTPIATPTTSPSKNKVSGKIVYQFDEEPASCPRSGQLYTHEQIPVQLKQGGKVILETLTSNGTFEFNQAFPNGDYDVCIKGTVFFRESGYYDGEDTYKWACTVQSKTGHDKGQCNTITINNNENVDTTFVLYKSDPGSEYGKKSSIHINMPYLEPKYSIYFKKLENILKYFQFKLDPGSHGNPTITAGEDKIELNYPDVVRVKQENSTYQLIDYKFSVRDNPSIELYLNDHINFGQLTNTQPITLDIPQKVDLGQALRYVQIKFKKDPNAKQYINNTAAIDIVFPVADFYIGGATHLTDNPPAPDKDKNRMIPFVENQAINISMADPNDDTRIKTLIWNKPGYDQYFGQELTLGISYTCIPKNEQTAYVNPMPAIYEQFPVDFNNSPHVYEYTLKCKP